VSVPEAAPGALQGFEGQLGRPANLVAQDLSRYVQMLKKWQHAQNLVSRETLNSVWSRHVRDSLQLLPHLNGHEGVVLDVGSGGGFPALPLAIALKGRDVRFHLAESNRRKCAFLRAVSRELDLPATVHAARLEDVESGVPGPVDLITCRATAPLWRMFPLLEPFVRPETRLLLHKGREYGEELREVDEAWDMVVIVLTSLTDQAGVILDISGLRRRPG